VEVSRQRLFSQMKYARYTINSVLVKAEARVYHLIIPARAKLFHFITHYKTRFAPLFRDQSAEINFFADEYHADLLYGNRLLCPVSFGMCRRI
jgi:hypothetical protein